MPLPLSPEILPLPPPPELLPSPHLLNSCPLQVTPDSHLHLVRKARANLNNKQLWAAKELFLWRDKVGHLNMFLF